MYIFSHGRCLTNKGRHQYNSRCGSDGHPIDADLTGEMSLSIVDSCETAIVVSMFDKKQLNEESVGSQSPVFEEMKEARSGYYDDSLTPIIKSGSINSSSKLSVDLLKSPSTFTLTDNNQLGDSFLKDVPICSTVQPNNHVRKHYILLYLFIIYFSLLESLYFIFFEDGMYCTKFT